MGTSTRIRNEQVGRCRCPRCELDFNPRDAWKRQRVRDSGNGEMKLRLWCPRCRRPKAYWVGFEVEKSGGVSRVHRVGIDLRR